MPVYSGLSALIQAATSQLGHLIDSDASEITHPSPSHAADGYASSSDGDRASTPTRTPTMVPEDSRSSKFMFPELLMSVLTDPENVNVVTFLPDGKFFAVRVNEFSNDLLHRHFHMSSYEEFLGMLRCWGFTEISSDEEAQGTSDVDEGSIQVFRHPHFRKGAAIDLEQVRYSPSHISIPPPSLPKSPASPGVDRTTSDDSSINSKRRLSPSHVERDLVDITPKYSALAGEVDTLDSHDNDFGSVVSYRSGSGHSRPARRRSSVEIRSKALAVTAAQLSLDDGHSADQGTSRAERRASLSLVDGAVDKATHNIVTDAIETLLFDEKHTRDTFMKHEKELSKSSLPGVIPISKQLFSRGVSENQRSNSRTEQIRAAARSLQPEASAASFKTLGQNPNHFADPTHLHAGTALGRQSKLKQAPSLSSSDEDDEDE